MTIGDLARRTGVAVKVVRRRQDMGLIYTRGRSPAGYRIFDEKALRCAKTAAHQWYSPPVSQTAGAERGERP
jgi:DNA-binding transcriptional MerR regulator